MANWFIASFQSRLARLQSAVMLRSASQISLLAASSLGKCPRVLMILRSRAFRLSIAFVVQITLRTAGGQRRPRATAAKALSPLLAAMRPWPRLVG